MKDTSCSWTALHLSLLQQVCLYIIPPNLHQLVLLSLHNTPTATNQTGACCVPCGLGITVTLYLSSPSQTTACSDTLNLFPFSARSHARGHETALLHAPNLLTFLSFSCSVLHSCVPSLCLSLSVCLSLSLRQRQGTSPPKRCRLTSASHLGHTHGV